MRPRSRKSSDGITQRRFVAWLALAVLCAGAVSFAGGAPARATTVSTWSIIPSASTSASQRNTLNSVACPNPTTCVAVGYFFNGSSDHTLAESWDGVAWKIVPSPDASASQNYFQGVACTSPRNCVAVGDFFNGTNLQTLVEAWDGVTWKIVPSPDTSGNDDFLTGVACTGPSSCIAVGYSENGLNNQTLIESWDGVAWKIVPSPNAPSKDLLQSVTCTSPAWCVAVGYFFAGSNDHTLVESWNGSTWSIVPSLDTSESQDNFLNSVNCTSPANCIAVGSFNNASNDQTLVESWNGSAWSIVSSPNASSGVGDFLNGVTCTGPANCTAVGHFIIGYGDEQTLVESWNGSAWSIVPSPNAAAGQLNDLYGVTCGTGSQCVAVGSSGQAASLQTLVESAHVLASGYYEVASDGGLFAYHVPFYGSTGGMHINQPVVGMATDPATGGYWEVASDGGLFAYNAPFYGSTGGMHINSPVVGMAYDPATGGYWEVASDGGLFAYNAPFLGSTGGMHINQPVVGMAVG